MALNSWLSDDYWVHAEQSSQWLDVVHTNSIMMNLLGPVIPMASGELSFPMFSSGVSVGWQTEGSAKAASKPVPTKSSIEAKLCYVLTALSKQLVDDSAPSAQAALASHASKALAAEIDAQILEGTGENDTIAGFYSNESLNSRAYATSIASTVSWGASLPSPRYVG